MGDYDAFAQGSWAYTDGVTTDLRPGWAHETDSYNLVNLGFGIGRGSWHVDLFIDNATDERAELDITDSYPFYDGNIRSDTFFSVNQPRTIGLRFGQKF